MGCEPVVGMKLKRTDSLENSTWTNICRELGIRKTDAVYCEAIVHCNGGLFMYVRANGKTGEEKVSCTNMSPWPSCLGDSHFRRMKDALPVSEERD